MHRKILASMVFALALCVHPVTGQESEMGKVLDRVKNGTPVERTEALSALGRLGPRGAGAIPTLIPLMESLDDDPGTADQIALTLVRIGSATVEPLVKSLKGKGGTRAARALGKIGPAASAAIPALTDHLKKAKEPEDWAVAAWALGSIGPKAHPAVPHLVASAQSQADPTQAVVALGRIGPGAKQAAPFLLKLVQAKENRHPVRIEALKAFQAVGGDPAPLFPFLIEQLADGQRPTPFPIYQALTRCGPPPKEIHPKLHQAMRSDVPRVRLFAAGILGKATPNDPSVVSVHLECLREGEPEVRGQAARSLGELRPRDEAVVIFLEKALQDPDPEVRRQVGAALKTLRK